MYYDGTTAQLGQPFSAGGGTYGDALQMTISMIPSSAGPPVVDVVLIGGDCRLSVLGSFGQDNPVSVSVLLGQAIAFRAGTDGTYYASYLGTVNFEEYLGYRDTFPTQLSIELNV